MRPPLFLVEKMLQHCQYFYLCNPDIVLSPPAMTGTAGKYCSAIIRREKNIAFEELVNRMEQLFILRKLVATVQTQFNNARQSEIFWLKRCCNTANIFIYATLT
jgi:hypothetical protein